MMKFKSSNFCSRYLKKFKLIPVFVPILASNNPGLEIGTCFSPGPLFGLFVFSFLFWLLLLF